MGRPSEFTAERGDKILERLALGETLLDICEDERMPDRRTVYRWCEANETFRLMYARARVDQADAWHDEAIKHARGTDAVSASADRLRFDALRWAASKASPKRYGDRIAHEVSGGDGAPVRLEHGIDADPDRLAALSQLLGEITGSGS